MKLQATGSAPAGHAEAAIHDDFRNAVLAGLAARPRAIPAKFLYDAEGSRLFDAITRLDDYYPTRTELGILEACAPEIARLAGPGAVLVEFGSGSSTKIRLLLDALEEPAAYLPIDISGEHLLRACRALARDYPALTVQPVVGDFTRSLSLPPLDRGRHVLGFFPGSTIGNFTPEEAGQFLGQAALTLGPGASFVLGVDLVKPAHILRAAYDDAKGVTAAFNLNLLRRINRELGGTFDLARFAHKIVWNEALDRIEMHLESLADQTVSVAGTSFAFAAGETIHTENSYKYRLDAFTGLAFSAGWRPLAHWTDEQALFSVHFLRRD
ncbi:L-histidine N(alpha)-methyltransferase [Marinimicrococcus flavescens]|uniref:L-histidine N(Alpha)-methyltransferase n=1 Tax=Marinimicrococcus flavescens TaxID=3031815 RepID=A0AAP3XSM0_9PROT|nr:L-histidine N(alpha)-methyltransferase [Marinimicrococcus flavescens]